VGSFKSAVTQRINALRGTPSAPVWQRNYYEHIIRTERALKAIRRYIAENPLRPALARELWRVLQADARSRPRGRGKMLDPGRGEALPRPYEDTHPGDPEVQP